MAFLRIILVFVKPALKFARNAITKMIASVRTAKLSLLMAMNAMTNRLNNLKAL
jgi:hypothetical protein